MATGPQQPVAESIDTKSMMREIAETVKRFYNAANEDVGPFRSEEAVCLEVEKSISEKYGDEQGKRASLIARKFMEKLSHQWEETHHKDVEDLSPTPEADGLSIARLKELLGNVKQKVENITNGEDAISTEDGIGADHADKSWLKQEPSNPSSITHKVKDTAKGLAAFLTGKDEQGMMARGELDTLESSDMTTILKLAGLNK